MLKGTLNFDKRLYDRIKKMNVAIIENTALIHQTELHVRVLEQSINDFRMESNKRFEAVMWTLDKIMHKIERVNTGSFS